jgi:hypothetical protein
VSLTQISQHLTSLPHFFNLIDGIMVGRGLPRVCKRCWRPFETPQACEEHKPTCERPTRQPSQWKKWSVYRQAFGEDGSALRTTLPSILWGQSDAADLTKSAETIQGLKKEVRDLNERLQFSEENQRALQMENQYLKFKEIQHVAAHPGSLVPVCQQPISGDNQAAWMNTLTIGQDLPPEQSGNPEYHRQQVNADILDVIHVGYDL